MALIDDLVIDTANKYLDCPGSVPTSTFHTSRALYSLLMDLFDESGGTSLSGSMALDEPMSAQTPTDFTIIKGWYGTQRLMRHLSGGSIQTSGYNNVVRLLSFQSSGYTNAVESDRGKVVTASGGNTGTLLDFDNATRKWWVRSGTAWGNSLAVSITSGTGAGTTTSSNGSATGEEKFSNLFTIGSIQTGNMYFVQGSSIVDGSGWYTTGNSNGNNSTVANLHLDVLVKIQEAGVLLSSGSVTVFNRANRSAAGGSNGNTYDWTTVDLSGLGRNTVALATSVDTNDTLTDAAIAAYIASGNGGTGATASIAVTFGSYSADVNADGTSEAYSVQVDCNGQPLSIVYQALKYITRKGASALLNDEQGQIYRYANAAYTPTKAAPFGTFAGGKFFGAQGIYLINIPSADASNYEVIDNGGTRRVPPTFVNVSVTGLVSGDRVAVFRTSSGAIDKGMFTAATGNTSGNGTFVVQESLPADLPSSGYIRVVHSATQTEQRYNYTGYNPSTKTFTLSGTLSQTYTNTDKAYVPFIDRSAAGASEAIAVQYASDRPLRVVVRNGAGGNKIVPFTVDGILTASGFSVPATRTPDTINNS